MAVIASCLVLLLAMTGHSTALYCLCKDGSSQSVLQKALDYACGAGADCSTILQNGVCFNPNTLQDHCNYAVNSYFQRKGQIPGSCDFAGAAMTSPNPPSNAVGSCVYPSSGSNSTGTGTTPPTTPTTTPTTTPSTTPTTTPPTTPSTTPTGAGPGTGTGVGAGPGTGTGVGAGPGTSTVFGGTGSSIGPTGTTSINDSSSVALFKLTNFILSSALAIWVSCLMMLWG